MPAGAPGIACRSAADSSAAFSVDAPLPIGNGAAFAGGDDREDAGDDEQPAATMAVQTSAAPATMFRRIGISVTLTRCLRLTPV